MKNVIHSFLSKESVFTDFREGLNELALTSNGHYVLNVLLCRTHPLMTCTWACDKHIPKFSDANNLSDYCMAMQEHVNLNHSSGITHTQIEKTRMCLNNLDHPSFKEFKNSLLQEMYGRHSTDRTKPNLCLITLLGTIQNHYLCVAPSTSTSYHNYNSSLINSLSLNNIDTSSDVDEHVNNAFCSNSKK